MHPANDKKKHCGPERYGIEVLSEQARQKMVQAIEQDASMEDKLNACINAIPEAVRAKVKASGREQEFEVATEFYAACHLRLELLQINGSKVYMHKENDSVALEDKLAEHGTVIYDILDKSVASEYLRAIRTVIEDRIRKEVGKGL